MTSSRPVDLDLLADYLEGLLSADDAAFVQDLVDTDPVWAATAEALENAYQPLAAALAAAPTADESMPDDVVARITAALAAERAPGRPATVVQLSDARRSRSRRVASSPWLRAAAAAVIVAVGLGFVVHAASNQSQRDSASGTAKYMGPQSAAARLPQIDGVSVTASGSVYGSQGYSMGSPVAPGSTRQPLHDSAGTGSTGTSSTGTSSTGTSSAGSVVPQPAGRGSVAEVPAALTRLLSVADLTSCLAAVRNSFGAAPTAVDFAYYASRPALVVTLGPGDRTVAVGPACGVSGDPDTMSGAVPR